MDVYEKESTLKKMDKEEKNDATLTQSDSKEEKMIKIEFKKKISKIKNLILQWSQSVTYHCFPKIFKEKTRFCMRFIWALIFLIFSSFTCYILVNNIISYYKYSVVSTIQIVNEQKSVFPLVTICNSNPFVTKYAENLTRNLAKEFFQVDLDNNLSFAFYVNNFPNKLASYMTSYINDPNYGDENRKRLSANLSEIIISCFFNYVPCNLTNDFQWFFHSSYGNCIQFNTNSFNLKMSTYQGKAYGLQLILGPLINQNKYPFTLSTGLKVLINNHSYALKSEDNLISIEPGKETDIIVERTLISNTPKPYSGCTYLSDAINSELYKFVLNSNKTYRQKDCIDFCYQRFIQKKCNCFDTTLPPFYQTLPCLNLTQVDCSIKIFIQDFDKFSCDLECPLECDFVAYNLQVSSLAFPSLEIYNIFQNDTKANEYFNLNGVDLSTYDLFKEMFYSINIYYSSLGYTYISESPQTTVFDLLSSLGGYVRFIVEILFELIWNLVFSKF
jgi:hypothetical protein